MQKITENDKARLGLTLALGMLVTLWRVLLPTNVEITTSIVILVAVLDIVLTAAVISLNKKELKEIFARKFGIKGFLKVILCFVLLFFFLELAMRLIQVVLLLGYRMPITISAILNQYITFDPSPANWVATEFHRVFPLGPFVSLAIAAPVWEEIVFRMAGRNLIKNTFLYLLITTLLFGFIHTGSFLTFSIISYLVLGLGYALIYLKTKDVRIVIAVHFLANFIGRIMAVMYQ